MSPDMRQTRLPGVGMKYGFELDGGGRIAVIQRVDGGGSSTGSGARTTTSPGRSSTSRTTRPASSGAVLGGAYERPKIVEDLELALGELAIEWIPVPEGSPAIGKSLADCAFRARTGITIIAILREPEPVTGAQPSDVIQAGDTLVTVGKLGQYAAFRRLLGEGPL